MPIGVGANLMCTSKMAYKKYIDHAHKTDEQTKQNLCRTQHFLVPRLSLHQVFLQRILT